MHKIVMFLRFPDHTDRTEAMRTLGGHHADLVLETPGVLRYVQNCVVSAATVAGLSADQPAVDGFEAIWFHDRRSFLLAATSSEWRAVLEDADNLCGDWLRKGWCAEVDERVKRQGLGAANDDIGTPPKGPIKLVGILRYRSDVERRWCNAYWASTHGDLALKVAQIGHYTQNHATRALLGDELAFDGFSESWYADQAAYEAAMASAEWAALGVDGNNLFDMAAFKSVVTDERVLRG